MNATTTKGETVKHKLECKMVFGRKDPSCPRCQELLNGAAPIQWRGAWRNEHTQRQREAIRSHDVTACAQANGVCTHFEY